MRNPCRLFKISPEIVRLAVMMYVRHGAIRTAEPAGEIGTIERFRGEASLALYLGMAALDHSSGKNRGSRAPKHVNARAKAAMTCLRRSEASASRRQVAAVDHHRKRVPQSQRHYEKKRAEGKRHNQAIRALGRHLCRVIFKMLSQERPVQPSPVLSWSSRPTTPSGFPCCPRFPCVHAAATTPVQRLGIVFAHLAQTYQPSP